MHGAKFSLSIVIAMQKFHCMTITFSFRYSYSKRNGIQAAPSRNRGIWDGLNG